MQDAFGGIMNLVFITVFLVLVSGILGFTVAYTKAFRMKNIVISYVEQYEGTGCFTDSTSISSKCRDKILEGAKSIGYSQLNVLNCPRGFSSSDDLFCYKRSDSVSRKNYIYSVVTQVDIDIPIINRILGFSFFQVHGDTRRIEK